MGAIEYSFVALSVNERYFRNHSQYFYGSLTSSGDLQASKFAQPQCCPNGKGMVGAAGFEPATFCSQSRRATRLRYAPTELAFDTRFDIARQASLSGR